jgi:hypothetical protein
MSALVTNDVFSTPTAFGSADLLLDVEELEAMEAPGFWDTVGGIAAGTVVGGAALYGGVAIGIAIT